MRILAVSDLQGNWDALEEIVSAHPNVEAVVHTGNIGLWNSSTVEQASDVNYLKQIVAFSELLPKNVVAELNDLSTINNAQDLGTANSVLAEFKSKLLSEAPLVHMDEYLAGKKRLPCPLYTTIGSLDDPYLVEKFVDGSLRIPNLNIIDHNHSYLLESPAKPPIRLYGLGGNLKVHSLFDSGKLGLNSVAGKVGDLWITLAQVAQLFVHMDRLEEKAINVFVSHSPVMKNPLLEHVAIMTGADYTISQGLHFRYPVSGNGMSFVDSMGGSAGYIENYRSKFSRLRMILGELWVIIKDDVARVLERSHPDLQKLVELGLSVFDKIPITISDSTEKIVRLTLYDEDEDEDDIDMSKQTLKKVNDMYFAAYYNLWHFNLCDYVIKDDDDDEVDYNLVIFRLKKNGNLALEHCNSSGFNFQREEYEEEDDDALRQTKDLLNSTYKDFKSRSKTKVTRRRGRYPQV
ncbi:uncharacterized protein CXQ87_005126 [Candidozyma duobushaemuli]|uniref:DUF2433 domain-containing protein n=2 Tax=Candidozyma TaxID=3303203 RepID=A0ABX8I9X9_9ASCO|nr:uncharacterized protein CXQ87_005126 [[Candida] duobushaemulonis]PVH14850.1 hypothetical protein CXQ87_005126 [[Candida] duobushaemulonis]QWU90066.1 hypothetical protein CA3LBN_004424 [[Candida] haemuloni]